jgi:Domain of unknown function (DUF4783)
MSKMLRHVSKMKTKFLLNIFFLFIVINPAGLAQDNVYNSKTGENQNSSQSFVFNQIESGIASGDLSLFQAYFSSQTYFSLVNGTNGYYSPNQSFYVLEDFFNEYEVTSFHINKIENEKDNPYAVGIYNYDHNGVKDSAQVYIALKKIGEGWKITQFSID